MREGVGCTSTTTGSTFSLSSAAHPKSTGIIKASKTTYLTHKTISVFIIIFFLSKIKIKGEIKFVKCLSVIHPIEQMYSTPPQVAPPLFPDGRKRGAERRKEGGEFRLDYTLFLTNFSVTA